MKSILSTKKLSVSQRELLINSGLSFIEYDAINIEFIDFEAPAQINNAIFTSQNSVNSFFMNGDRSNLIKNSFCVGEKTEALLLDFDQKVIKKVENASELVRFIIKYHQNDKFLYFSGTRRRDELPEALKKAKIDVFEIKTYKTELKITKFAQKWDGILFFSPSGVESFTLGNNMADSTAFCIGETTASEAKRYTNNVIVANSTTVESVIAEAVNALKKN
jgi:uroporphyrinogen-III synthase